MLAAATSSASRRAGAIRPRASLISSAGTRSESSRTPSKRSVSRRSASSPPARTSPRIARTAATGPSAARASIRGRGRRSTIRREPPRGCGPALAPSPAERRSRRSSIRREATEGPWRGRHANPGQTGPKRRRRPHSGPSLHRDARRRIPASLSNQVAGTWLVPEMVPHTTFRATPLASSGTRPNGTPAPPADRQASRRTDVRQHADLAAGLAGQAHPAAVQDHPQAEVTSGGRAAGRS